MVNGMQLTTYCIDWHTYLMDKTDWSNLYDILVMENI
jgi:hypothetical protein